MAVKNEEGDDLGSTLKQLRLAAGLTQEALAEKAGISARTVSDLERGLRSVVHNDTARRLASALGLADEQHPGSMLSRAAGPSTHYRIPQQAGFPRF